MTPKLPSRRAALLAGLSLPLLAACGSQDASPVDATTPQGTPADIEKALAEGGTVTYWTWVPGIEKTVAAFESQYPNVKVNLVNPGRGSAAYTKMFNTVKAGSGAPDVAQVEFNVLPQFVVTDALVDLGSFGLDATLRDTFTASAWDQATIDGKTWSIPQDTGPMFVMYRQDVLSSLGAEPPATWEDFRTLAEGIRASGKNRYITAYDPSDAGFGNSLIWQAGGKPFSITDKTTVKLDLRDSGSTRAIDYWGSLIQDDLVKPMPTWTNEWWQELAAGELAIWMPGAWGPGTAESSIGDASMGAWRAAPLPSWEAGVPVNAENGGSSNAVFRQSKNPALAFGFAQWVNASGAGAKSLNEIGLFPATRQLLADEEFLSAKSPFLGNQEANRVLGGGAADVVPGWEFLPFQAYAGSVFGDTVGWAVTEGRPLRDGYDAWEEKLRRFGDIQGFTMA